MVSIGSLRYLYIGSAEVKRDIAYWCDVLGATLEWDIEGMGTEVAAVSLSASPPVLLAGHRPAGSILAIFAPDDFDATVSGLAQRGWTADKVVEVPEGPCHVFHDPSGHEMAILDVVRPEVWGYLQSRTGEE